MRCRLSALSNEISGQSLNGLAAPQIVGRSDPNTPQVSWATERCWQAPDEPRELQLVLHGENPVVRKNSRIPDLGQNRFGGKFITCTGRYVAPCRDSNSYHSRSSVCYLVSTALIGMTGTVIMTATKMGVVPASFCRPLVYGVLRKVLLFYKFT